ncbi:hypothetical protein KKG58_03985 [Patescibacteria group bacterium]|nr:hypothetical protein [Patescibacteria group bacterium]
MESLEKEVVRCLKFHYSFLYRELRSRRRTLGKVVNYLRSHKNETHVWPIKFLYRLVEKMMLSRKARLRSKIVSLENDITEYKYAQSGLKHGDKSLAIRVLEKIRKGLEPFLNLDTNSEFNLATENPLYKRVERLIKDLSTA